MKKTKIFDPADGFAPLVNAAEITDSTVVQRGDRWWMYLAGQRKNDDGIHLYSASLPEGSPLAANGWKLTFDPKTPTNIALLAGNERSNGWDARGGRHCPCYVKGWDTERQAWVERIYYAGAAENPWGPYTIGYLEWDGLQWADQPQPVFTANEEWEHGSVYEPNLIFHEGKWRMWYVAGSNLEDYLIHGYAESADGRTGWSQHKIFAPAVMKLFDFCVLKVGSSFEAVFSRVWLGKTAPPAETGLWWCRADLPASDLSAWSEPVQIMTAESHGWHSGPWKPSIQYSDAEPGKLFVFFDGAYTTDEPGGFPFAFTLGCLEIERPG
jgi:hypothetical protein